MSLLATLPAVVGADLTVPVGDGVLPYANLDYAASAPCLAAVQEAVTRALPTYSSVHRGAGYASQVTTRAYEEARGTVREFLGGPQAVVFVRNTTDAFNLLARAVPNGTGVVVFDSEHHATQLPWRHAVRLTPPATPAAAVAAAREALEACPVGPRLLVVTAASNVTGELWPVRELADLAHACGARIAVDAAQYVAHRPLDATGLDYVAFSGHKLYAPFGTGVLAGRADWLRAAAPYLRGGGATRSVALDGRVEWTADAEQRHEAGTPNVLGAVALAAACRELSADWDAVVAAETRLLERLRSGLAQVPGLRELSLWGPDHPRLGILAFTVEGHSARDVAQHLADRHGIGVRDGKFCAHPLLAHLLGGSGGCDEDGTAVRASLGLGTVDEHVDRLVAGLRELVG
ncbi:aminotransferase class V-fold PLP-dependent enzyme [Nocardioides sp. Soil796]|uniref:aminotransferase class V-fold PLP-dependent enzyme n=1 Tax=Nocardioides sp. Soil796 TaxID=1736412 RepID=UPI00070FF675|nr:aminotransferase class V-fold PLP-dependent enzyme [Nocardioides sp. Soil796]KRF15673.1 cysteine desulfurase [Nocardioides sp. Soil796]